MSTVVTLQARHFELIANTLKQVKEGRAWSGWNETQHNVTCAHFADRLRSTNPNFNRERFLKACGVEQ